MPTTILLIITVWIDVFAIILLLLQNRGLNREIQELNNKRNDLIAERNDLIAERNDWKDSYYDLRRKEINLKSSYVFNTNILDRDKDREYFQIMEVNFEDKGNNCVLTYTVCRDGQQPRILSITSKSIRQRL